MYEPPSHPAEADEQHIQLMKIFGYATITNFIKTKSVFDDMKCVFNIGTYRRFLIVYVSFPFYRVIGYLQSKDFLSNTVCL